MKIKLFEEYSDNSNNQYYEKIGIKGWEKLTKIDITDRTMQRLRNLSSNSFKFINGDIVWSKLNTPPLPSSEGFRSIKACYCYSNDGKVIFSIIECEDDYYVLSEIDSSPFIHYRCDQFDGLVKLLKDKNYL